MRALPSLSLPWRAAPVAVTFLFPLLVAVPACGPSGGSAITGDACATSADCASVFCAGDPFPGGYCSADCSATACSDGSNCTNYQGNQLCLLPCGAATDCRDGYMCWQGSCVPSCQSDGDCGSGFNCKSGQCTAVVVMVQPGAAVGARCKVNKDCGSNDCEPQSNTCQVPCGRDGDCPSGQTCYLNYVDTSSSGFTDGVRPICVNARAGKSDPMATCAGDGDCRLGQCLLSHCVGLCTAAADCAGDESCGSLWAETANNEIMVKGCLPKNATLDVDLGLDGTGPIGIPSGAVSLGLYLEAVNQDSSYYVGYSDVTDPSGTIIYSSSVDYYGNPLRFQANAGAVYMLISNSPSVSFMPLGYYSFTPFAEGTGGTGSTDYNLRARIKMHDGPVTSGKLKLHVYITNLSGGCTTFNAASAPTVLADFESEIKRIYAQAGITFDEVKYIDSSAPSSITVSNTAISTELDALLKTATAPDGPDALEVVIVKHIYSSTEASGLEVLGVSGGIPGSTGIPGTIRSGAAVSLSALCPDFPGQPLDGTTFAVTASHELGHSLGLFHNVEQDGHFDQFADDDADGQNNLMYWEEGENGAGTHLSAGQSGVFLVNPAVRP